MGKSVSAKGPEGACAIYSDGERLVGKWMISILDVLHRGAFRTSRDSDQEIGEMWVKIETGEKGSLGAAAVGEIKCSRQGGEWGGSPRCESRFWGEWLLGWGAGMWSM